MSTGAMIGHGTLFQTESLGSPSEWETVAEVSNIMPPVPSRDAIDLTHEHAPNEWRTSMPGMKSAGEVSFKFNFIPGGATYDDLYEEMDDQVIRARRLVFPNGAILPFDAFLKSIEPDAKTDTAITATAKFQVSGEAGPFE